MGKTIQKFLKMTPFVKAGHPSVTWLGEALGMAAKLAGQPSIYLFDSGYASFNSNGAVNGWHYYIQDYMGNDRMVVNMNGTTEQVTICHSVIVKKIYGCKKMMSYEKDASCYTIIIYAKSICAL